MSTGFDVIRRKLEQLAPDGFQLVRHGTLG